jgi:molybdopterin synthase catalytic subunit
MNESSLLINLEKKKIKIAEISAFLRVPEAGAHVLFHGTARDHSDGARVVQLRYEAYEEMALSEMHRIAREAMARWPIQRIAMVHRLGKVPLTQDAVVIGVAASHRAEAFEACRFLIDALKSSAPIWKEEIWEKGSRWASNASRTG